MLDPFVSPDSDETQIRHKYPVGIMLRIDITAEPRFLARFRFFLLVTSVSTSLPSIVYGMMSALHFICYTGLIYFFFSFTLIHLRFTFRFLGYYPCHKIVYAYISIE